MPNRCSIPECRAISNKIFGKISVFRIPKNEANRAKWLKSIGRKDWNPGDKAVICEKHFDPSCISKKEFRVDRNGDKKFPSRIRPVLSAGALPTIFDKIPIVAKRPVEKVRENVSGTARKRRRRRKLLEKPREKRRKRNGKISDSMPLQQRLTSQAASSTTQEDTLKSQPLSPTKLKVTRQSASKLSAPAQEAPSPSSPDNEEVCLRWNSHYTNMQTTFPSLLSKEQYCDVTLVAEGKSLKCHKLILSSCSSYFDQVLEKIMPYQHPVIFMKDIPFNILKALCDFMYAGEVNIQQGDLNQLLAVADSLKIKGLVNKPDSETTNIPSTADVGEQVKEAVPKVSKAPPKTSSTSEKKVSLKNKEIIDPLDLLEPTYEEEATPDFPPPQLKRNDQTRKSTGRRIRKRKHVGDDHEPSPPVFKARKGTRSRPNVKVPRYFNASFDNSNDKSAIAAADSCEMSQVDESCVDPLMYAMDEIKTEPLDIEDGLISYDEEESFDIAEEQTAPGPSSGRPKRAGAATSSSRPTAKQEKEDAPDPLNVDVDQERSKLLGYERATENNNGDESANPVTDESQEAYVDSSALSGDALPAEISSSDTPPADHGLITEAATSQITLSIADTFGGVETSDNGET